MHIPHHESDSLFSYDTNSLPRVRLVVIGQGVEVLCTNKTSKRLNTNYQVKFYIKNFLNWRHFILQAIGILARCRVQAIREPY